MFQPSQHDVRRFFCETFRKQRDGVPLTPMETLAGGWIAEHPEYHADLADLEAALAAVYTVDDGRTNPFLHLAMHLSISEQCSIDQPSGIRQAVELLAARPMATPTSTPCAAAPRAEPPTNKGPVPRTGRMRRRLAHVDPDEGHRPSGRRPRRSP